LTTLVFTFNDASTKMIRVAAVFGCVAASGALSALEPKHLGVTSVAENKQETHVVHVNEKQTKPKLVALSRKSVAVKPLEPKLTPESDEKFMKGDYPYDNRPKVTGKFDGVYPKMQSTEKYNSDYVKDENGDGGHWAAQMKYDELKNKLASQRKATKSALSKEQEERKEYEKAKGKHKDANEKASIAEKEAEEAEKEAGVAEQDLEKAEEADKKEKDKEPQNLAAAEEKVQKAQLNLKGCEQKLEDARNDLEEMKKQSQEKETAGKEKSSKASAKQSAADKEAQKERADADAATAAAQAERQKVQAERDEHEKAKKEYEAEKAEEEKTESELEKAETELRKLRGEEPKQTVAKEKSGTTSCSPVLAVAGAFSFWFLK